MRGVATLRERQPGVWEIRVYVGRDPVTGAPRQVSRVVHAGRRTRKGEPPKAVKAEAARLETEAARGKLGGTSATLGLLLERYFEQLERKDHSPSTLAAYRRYVRLHILPADEDNPRSPGGSAADSGSPHVAAGKTTPQGLPALGLRQVRQLSGWDLDNLYAGMIDNGKGAATVRQLHAILSGALGQAVKWGWCETNVARMASPPRVRQQKILPPTPDEVRAIVTKAEERNSTVAALIMLAALTGARRGELCALRWADVDLHAGTVRISRSIVDLPGKPLVEKATKAHSERTLALGDAGVSLLKLHHAHVADRATVGDVSIGAESFVFSDQVESTTPLRPDNVSSFFRRVRDDLELPHVHLHSLRHFVATQLAARGDVSARTLAGRLGHADASVSLKVYSAFFPPADAEAAEYVGSVLRQSNGGKD